MICKPMEMCVGACNAKDPGTVSPGPARKHNGNKVAALSVSAFSAIMAGFAGGFAQARSEAVPVDRQFPEGLEGLQVSATGWANLAGVAWNVSASRVQARSRAVPSRL